MKDLRRCDYCGKEARDIEAFGWWEAKRLYPVSIVQAEDDYDFCTYECLSRWVESRREDNK